MPGAWAGWLGGGAPGPVLGAVLVDVARVCTGASGPTGQARSPPHPPPFTSFTCSILLKKSSVPKKLKSHPGYLEHGWPHTGLPRFTGLHGWCAVGTRKGCGDPGPGRSVSAILPEVFARFASVTFWQFLHYFRPSRYPVCRGDL